MSSTIIKKIVGTSAVGVLALGAVIVSVPGALAMANDGVQSIAQKNHGQKPNCVDGEHIDRGNNKNRGHGGCGYGYGHDHGNGNGNHRGVRHKDHNN